MVIAADVLEHVRRPEQLLTELHGVMAPSGMLIASVPNATGTAKRVALGLFDYDRRGILDQTHLRFFTRRSFERLCHTHGWRVARQGYTGLPLEVVERGEAGDQPAAAVDGSARRLVRRLDATAVRARPNLFAYQMLYQLESARPVAPAAAEPTQPAVATS